MVSGHEKPQQIVSGINEMVEQCHRRGRRKTHKKHLQKRYCNLTKDKQEFHKTRLYTRLCT